MIFSTVGMITSQADKPKVRTIEHTASGPRVEFTLGDFTRTRQLHDFDRDGWCDLWCAMFPGIDHRNKATDTDGDGLTDYQEMVLMRSPEAENPMPRHLTPAEIADTGKRAAAAKLVAEKEMAERRKMLAPFMVDGNKEGKTSAQLKAEQMTRRTAKLMAAKRDFEAKQAAKEDKVLEYMNRTGEPRSGIDASGKFFMLESNGDKVYKKSGHNVTSADSISTDEVLPFNQLLVNAGLGGTGSSGFDLTGLGQKMAVWDENDILLTHNFMIGRVSDKDGFNALNAHSTHVAGTMISNGNGALLGRGMSISGTLDAYDFEDDLTELPTAVSPTPGNGVNLSNHSYGFRHGWDGLVNYAGAIRLIWRGDVTVDLDEDYIFGFYSSFARDVDAISYDSQTWLPVWSAGNDRDNQDGPITPTEHLGHVYFDADGAPQLSNRDRPNDETVDGGYDLITHYSIAKNALIVAANEDVNGGYSGTGSVVMSSFSSWGGADDGRIKPDISANGVGLISSAITGGTLSQSGTSMSAPSVCGSINLLREQYETLLGDSEEVLSSTWKALTIHTADETGTASGPDYRFGWGMMNTLKAATLIADHASNLDSLPFIKEVPLPSGDFVQFTVKAQGGQPLIVTCCWVDPEGGVPPKALDANVAALVNDIDLRIEKNGTTHFPWKLNPAAHSAAATRNSDNDRDNVERVDIDSPVAGEEYTIKITHKGNLIDDTGAVSPQNLSIVVSGNQIEAAPVLQVGELLQTAPTEFTAIFQTVVGGKYEIETSETLGAGSWTTVMTDIRPTKDLTAIALPTAGADHKFWRINRTK